jgi:hypothetical protein
VHNPLKSPHDAVFAGCTDQWDEFGGASLPGPLGSDRNGNDCDPAVAALSRGLVSFCEVAADSPESSELFSWGISGFPQHAVDAAAEFAPSNRPPREAPLFKLLLGVWRDIHWRGHGRASHAAFRFRILAACLRIAAACGGADGRRITRVLDEVAAIVGPGCERDADS